MERIVADITLRTHVESSTSRCSQRPKVQVGVSALRLSLFAVSVSDPR